jgi:5-methyltetrahydropteroyltriglutamate--homocysteine methyltransferase
VPDDGARIIQIDEPATSVQPEELPIMIEAMQLVPEGIPAHFIPHMCYGTFELIYPDLLKSPADNFDLAISNTELDLIKIFEKHPFTRDISVGIVDVHSHVIEELETVKSRIRRALEVFPRESAWIDPDCGVKTRTVDEAIAKMRAMLEATKTFGK